MRSLFSVLSFISLFVWITSSAFALDVTYYADDFEWGTTANGEVFSQNIYSAALCSDTLGEYMYVYTSSTWVIVKHNDRPNCRKQSDLIDLSRVGFTAFAPTSVGRFSSATWVSLGVLPVSLKKDFSRDVFSSFWVELSGAIPNTFRTGEWLVLRGRVTDSKKTVFLYIENKNTWVSKNSIVRTRSDGTFSLPFVFPSDAGEYYFILSSGNSFETTNPPRVYVVDSSVLKYPYLPHNNTNTNIRININSETDTPFVSLPSSVYGEMEVQFDGRVKKFIWKDIVFDLPSYFLGQGSFVFTGYTLSTPSSLDRSPIPVYGSSESVFLDRIHEYIWKEKVVIQKWKKSINFRFRLSQDAKIREVFFVTLPNGDVREYSFPKKYVETDWYLKRWILIQASFPAQETWTYKLEAVDSTGFAYFNLPITQGKVWNVVRVVSEEENARIRKDGTLVQKSVLNSINTLRASLGRDLLIIDPLLSDIARIKAEDMAKYDYVGHYTQDGNNLTVEWLARTRGITLPRPYAENVAGWNISDIALQDGLEESWSHRYTMINPLYTKIGVGYVFQDGKTYLVQVFWK